MKLLRISDENPNRGLNFDLIDILSLIDEKIGQLLSWKMKDIEVTVDKDLEGKASELYWKIYTSDDWQIVSWVELELLANSIMQFVWMTLEGELGDYRLNIRAFDSSYWYIETNDEDLVKRIFERFDEVEVL